MNAYDWVRISSFRYDIKKNMLVVYGSNFAGDKIVFNNVYLEGMVRHRSSVPFNGYKRYLDLARIKDGNKNVIIFSTFGDLETMSEYFGYGLYAYVSEYEGGPNITEKELARFPKFFKCCGRYGLAEEFGDGSRVSVYVYFQDNRIFVIGEFYRSDGRMLGLSDVSYNGLDKLRQSFWALWVNRRKILKWVEMMGTNSGVW